MESIDDKKIKKVILSRKACSHYLKMWKKKRTIISDITFGVPEEKEEEELVEEETVEVESKDVKNLSEFELLEEFSNRIWEKFLKEPMNKILKETNQAMFKKCMNVFYESYSEGQIACILKSQTANQAELCLSMSDKKLREYTKKYEKISVKDFEI